MKTSKQHERYWRNRKADWKEKYLFGVGAMDHPHRQLILKALQHIPCGSVLELGCNAGVNLYLISKAFPHIRLGGCDVNAASLEVAREYLPPSTILHHASADNLFFSDQSTDVTLTDMCLIYFDTKRLRKTLQRMRMTTRNAIILCEFHSTSVWQRFWLWLKSSYYAHDFISELERSGFYDIELKKLTVNDWPGGHPQKQFAYLIIAKPLK